jgi:hypothetical protein
MDYTCHYNKLIERAPKIKPLNYYTEGHHIKPRCMGGTNADGIAYLTPEEHRRKISESNKRTYALKHNLL